MDFEWFSGDDMIEAERDYISSKSTASIVKSICTELAIMLVVAFADFMILLTTDFSRVPVAIWIIEGIVFLFLTCANFQGIVVKYQIKYGKFKWRDGTVDKVVHAQHTGHKNMMRHLIIDGVAVDMPESIARFKEGMSVVVIDTGFSGQYAFTRDITKDCHRYRYMYDKSSNC